MIRKAFQWGIVAHRCTRARNRGGALTATEAPPGVSLGRRGYPVVLRQHHEELLSLQAVFPPKPFNMLKGFRCVHTFL